MTSNLRAFLVLIALLFSATSSAADGLPRIEVWKDPNCGCCSKWIAHLQQAGFPVVAHDTAQVAAARDRLGMPQRYAACHTARVDGYVIEGHVPASDIKRLLGERPTATGLAVPGMPVGSPGMEASYSEPYQTLLIDNAGNPSVFSEH